MNQQQFRLADLTKHLQVNSATEKNMLDDLHKHLSTAMIDENATALKGIALSHENKIFFPGEEKQAEQPPQQTPTEKATHKVFIRDTPLRSSQITTAVPDWGAGAAVDKTVGPFIGNDGRQFWYDFYPIEELIALYIQGNTMPVMLFHISTFRRIIEHLPFFNSNNNSYTLTGNTVWIYSQVFTKTAPADYYTGLKIKDGSIKFSEVPQHINNNLTAQAGVTITVTLNLDQPVVTGADASSDYGKDARAASLTLPQQFNFHFSGISPMVIDSISDTSWNLYGEEDSFKFNPQNPISYDDLIKEILIPFTCSSSQFSINNNLSTFNTFSESAPIQWIAWALPVALIDINNPTAAEGIGSLTIRCSKGLFTEWKGMQNGAAALNNPYIQLSVGKIGVIDLAAINAFGTQEFLLWKDNINPHRSSIELFFNTAFPFLFAADVAGTEIIAAQTNTIAHIDRPVTVSAQPVAVKTKNSLLMLAASNTQRLLYLYDDNIEADNAGNVIAYFPKPISFALNNAVFKTSQPKGCLLFGSLAENFINVENAYLILTFGLYAYLPILPDPYVANLGVLKRQFLSGRDVAGVNETYSSATFQQEWLLLVCTIQWKQKNKDTDIIDVAFSFAPLPQQQTAYSALAFNKINVGLNQTQSPVQNNTFINEFNANQTAADLSISQNISTQNTNAETTKKTTLYSKSVQGRLPDYQSDWDERYSVFQNDMFALLDVSSNANQLGVSFQVSFLRDHSTKESGEYLMYKTYDVDSTNQSGFPLQVDGMNVISENRNVKAFMLPQVSWEPVKNLTEPEKSGDPAMSFNYYPNDGGATRIFNNSVQFVPIAPIPVASSLIKAYEQENNNKLGAIFTLPFGIRAISILDKKSQTPAPLIDTNAPVFDGKYFGGIQLKLTGGNSGNTDVSDQFHGATVQVNNILSLTGAATGNSTLGFDVTTIFNGEFYEADETSVPVTRFDLSGYGASIFSNWHNKGAEFATTSQAEFEVFVGRTAHEVVQVKSVLYPWGIHVVRTITLFRAASGYEYRYDSGWKAEGDGKFDFSFSVVTDDTTDPVTKHKVVPYEIHPGTIKGLYNVKNIKSAVKDIAPFTDSMDITGFYEFNAFSKFIYPYTSATSPVDVDLEPVYFDADIEIENTIQGQLNGRVPAKKILGFVQVKPTGLPLTPASFQKLLRRQDDSIGGPLDCIIDIGLNGQQMRLNRIDVNNSADASGTNPVFVVAARGNVILPKEGSWSMVKHIADTGEVIPLPQGITVPLIRIGKLDENLNFPVDGLLRIANPTELLKAPDDETINFGYLQSTNTQKALFLTPAYQKLADATQVGKLFSKTPPLFADAYRIMNSKGIFPNIGDAVNNFGDIIPLAENFTKNTITDAGKQVLELMQVNLKDAEGKVLQQGYKLLKQIETFDLPDSDWPLVDISGLKIYVQYKAAVRNGNAVPKKGDGSPDYNNASNFNNTAGLLNFDVDSFASNVADNWKSKLNNISMVIDLGPFKSLATIKGNFNAQNGSEAAYEGDSSNPDFQAPQLSFGPDLDVVMDILQILVDLQTGDYADAVKKGLKIAMSNSADSWSYKFDASKEIPVVKFPTPDIVYDDPNTPLKLEASLKFGVYFNETLKVTTDPSQLLPTAGAYIDFYGKLSVMCVSLSVATIYAVGTVDLRIAADTGTGPSLDMKFGFGAQIVVGLPVVGSVSVLYMMGIQIYLDSNTTTVTASLLFQGHADLLGGLLEITITIEAQGGISRSNDQTICEAQVTFAIDISIFLVIDIDFSKSWSEQRQIA